MNSSLMAVAVAENVMRFVIEENGMCWVPVHNVESLLDVTLTGSLLISSMGMAVCSIISKAQSDITSCTQELEEMDSIDTKEFTRNALVAARYYFERGYSHVNFLSYCAIVAGVAAELYQRRNLDLPCCAAEVIGIVLTAHILTRKFTETGGYEKLLETCINFNEAIEKQKTENTAQENSAEQASKIGRHM